MPIGAQLDYCTPCMPAPSSKKSFIPFVIRSMRTIRLILPLAALLAACDTRAGQQMRSLAHSDSLRTDSLVTIKNDLLNEVLASTQFVNDLNTEMGKLKSRRPAKLSSTLTRESDLSLIKEERASVVAHIRELVARLDSSEARVVT